MNINHLQDKKYYHISINIDSLSEYILLASSEKRRSYYNLSLNSQYNKFCNGDNGYIDDERWIIREATIDEINWLEMCRAAGKYIENPKLTYEIY